MVLGVVGCIEGSRLPTPSSDATDASILEQFDTRTADGAYRCGFFPDTCPKGFNCFSVVDDGDLERRCLRHTGGAEKGAECDPSSPGVCGDGMRCVEERCRPICAPHDTSKYGCESESVCLPVEVGGDRIGWGVCERRADNCTLWPSDSCPEGQNCYTLRQGKRCRDYDEDAQVGDACQRSTECNRDQVCVDLTEDQTANATCRQKCDGQRPCDSGTCQVISDQGFGACAPHTSGG